ncbi:FYVE RhoGEF and PH domain containing 2 [Cricetulus griseus]
MLSSCSLWATLPTLLLLLTVTGPTSALTEDEKQTMVELHNFYRAQVSPPASDMLQMRWDDDLAAFAKAYAEKCVWGHNKERGRRGENLFAITDEGMDVVWSKTERIGCGSHFCETLQGVEEANIHLLVCNYEPPKQLHGSQPPRGLPLGTGKKVRTFPCSKAFSFRGNVKGRKPYQEGTPCSQCPLGYSCENFLCEPTRNPEQAQDSPPRVTEVPSTRAAEAPSSRETGTPSLATSETLRFSSVTKVSDSLATESSPAVETKAPSSLATEGPSSMATEAPSYLREVSSISDAHIQPSLDEEPVNFLTSPHAPVTKYTDKDASKSSATSLSPEKSPYPKMSPTQTGEVLPQTQVETEAQLPEAEAELPEAEAELPVSSEVVVPVLPTQELSGQQASLDHSGHPASTALPNFPRASAWANASVGRTLALQSTGTGAALQGSQKRWTQIPGCTSPALPPGQGLHWPVASLPASGVAEACGMEDTSEEKQQASVCNLVAVFENSRTLGTTPGPHSADEQPQSPERKLPLSPGPWEAPPVEEAMKPEFRPVSRTYLSSLKNKLSSGAWRKSYQPGASPGPETQVFFQELLKEAGRSKAFPEEVVRLIFSNISSIYCFHAQFFLPELQRRVDDWTATPRIGDVIQKLAPFLKMYSEYVKNFERAAELLATWMDKSQPFQEIVTRIQVWGAVQGSSSPLRPGAPLSLPSSSCPCSLLPKRSEASGSLTLQHHMLEPVQRIPRYELLLKEYVQKLPAQAPDRADAQSEDTMGPGKERLQGLWEVYQRLGLEDDIVDPSNTLLREGPVLKISFRRSDPMERYLFLFNNMLLYCVPRVLQVGAQFQVRTRIDVAGMKACQAAIDQVEKRSETFKAAVQGPQGDAQESKPQAEELGIRAPQWVRDKMVTMCMRCQEPFNALTRRRHHCRACGYVVCGKCSDYRAELKYDSNRPNRVCLACYTFLTGNVLPDSKEDKRKGILEKESLAGPDQSLMCSFLQLLGDKWSRSGPRGWCVIPRDDPLVLYVYAAPQDIKAHTSIPLLGYQVIAGPQGDPRVFQLHQSGQMYTFKAESEELQGRWVRAIKRAANGWTPEEPDEEDMSD